MANPVIITCAVTGGTDHAHKNPAVPVTPAQIAASAVEAADAGAAIVHVHVRDPETTLASTDFALYAETVDLIRQARPDLIINLSSGYGAMVTADQIRDGRSAAKALLTPEARVEHIVRLRPEICSLDIAAMNFGEQMFLNSIPDLRVMAGLIEGAGVKPELEAFDMGHLGIIRHFLKKGVLSSPPLVQIGLGVMGGADPDPHSMSALVWLLPEDAAWAIFGIGRHQFPVATQAMLMGGHVRLGLEDNLYLEDGVLAPSNAALVERMVAIMGLLGRRPATTDEARATLGLRRAG